MMYKHFFAKQGLYDLRFEHDSCGVGFVCDIHGKRTNEILTLGITALKRLEHRGAVGADPLTGDGAGILIQTPHKFFQKIAEESKIKLPKKGDYGSGLIFFPSSKDGYEFCKRVFEKVINDNGQKLLGWRTVPTDNSFIGKTARKTQPVIEQVFIQKTSNLSPIEFERRLYIIRKEIEKRIRNSNLANKHQFYISNLSSRTFSYKGLLMSRQLEDFFIDLKDNDIETSICLFHARYSTNTFPTWDLAQPFRFLAHNGEINTLRGNINWMHAREGVLKSNIWGPDIRKLLPIIVPGGSDSAVLDNVFEFLVLSGRNIEEAMMMLIPPAWEKDKSIPQHIKDFYIFHGCFMEPWDGPASIAFTDGTSIGAILDRNGLRPSRYIVTTDNVVVMASEVGVLDIEERKIALSERLHPGKMFLVNTEEGRIIPDQEIKETVAKKNPYGEWLKTNMVFIENLPYKGHQEIQIDNLSQQLIAFGYTREDLKFIIKPMVEKAHEPIGSMGNDTPLAVFSKEKPLLYNYFKQLFAQVTNPAIDPIREECVMSLHSFVGKEENILQETPEHCKKLMVNRPILTNKELAQIKDIEIKGFKTKVIPILFKRNSYHSFIQRLEAICKESINAIEEGFTFIILSDRGVNQEFSAIPALLAVGKVHHYLVKKAMRTRIGIIIETGEAREVHHFALLLGYGVDLINPYLAYETIKFMLKNKMINGLDYITAEKNYIKAIDKGILKILSKMGISTVQSYRGAQVFEALGISENVINDCFCGTVSRIGGIDFEDIYEETVARHKQAFPENISPPTILSSGGRYQWKKDGEHHLWNPETIALLHHAVRKEDFKKYKEFAELINNQKDRPVTLRGLLEFKTDSPISIDEVEPKEEIVKRFATGAMSFGSISQEAHTTIAIAMNRLKAMSNSGEGGEDPQRFYPLPNGDSLCSKVKQVASGRFGVTTYYLVNAEELQIKIAQGAKPGEGGHLPDHKVSGIIARTRYTTPGVTLISPPPHHDIYSIEDLAQLIFDLKNANPQARISVKLVSEIGVGTIAAGVAKGHADMILISGGDGGTGASPLSSIHHAGLPWELGLSETHQTLVLNDLRSRVRLQTDGQMRTGQDVVIAAILGAEEFGFCTAALVVLGCVMLRHCHLNNCSVGIATQDELLCKRFTGRPEYLINYFYFVAEETREIMAKLGVKTIEELIGRTDLLIPQKYCSQQNGKIKKVDYSRILYKPDVSEEIKTYKTIPQDHGIDTVLDKTLINLCQDSINKGKETNLNISIKNYNRTVGAMLSGEIAKKWGEEGLPHDTIKIKFKGEAGQSFAAFLIKGITFELEGLANDYVGKGMFGGKLIIYPYRNVPYKPEDNIIIGNTCFYGAIRGEAYIRGIAGERFCIRNSGLYAVVEGVGDHGCEYMTGGRVVILGETGKNFAAGMSGGIAYVYDPKKVFKERCNLEMVELEMINEEDRDLIYNLVYNHHRYTDSKVAEKILNEFSLAIRAFVKVMPLEYKRVLEGQKKQEEIDSLEISDG